MLVDFPIVTWLLVVPAVSSILVVLLGRDPRTARFLGLGLSLVPLALSLVLVAGLLTPGAVQLTSYDAGRFTYYAFERAPWLPQIGVGYIVGVDELSVALVFLTTLLTTLALAFAWDEGHRVREFYALFLLMETTVLGVFLSLDLFLFFLFWELGLVPMYFIIAVWGGPRKRYAALKFFFFTFAAGIPVLVGIFALYFYATPSTFDMTVLIETNPLPVGIIANFLFLALIIGFGTKLPTWPLHTWLPDAHVEAPTAGSVLLAGVLLKLGGYAIIRIAVQMNLAAAKEMWPVLAVLGTISIVYGAIVCLAQNDLKRLVAFSSVSHMGFVTLGIAAGIVAYGSLATQPGARLGFAGAIFQMFAHGLVSAALFMIAGSIGHKIGTRNITDLGGITPKAPVLGSFMMVAFMASLGLPGLVGFVAELAVFLGVYAAFGFLVFIPIATVVLTAAYYIWAMQRAIFGPLNERWKDMPDAHGFESAPLAVLVFLFVLFGILPFLFLDMMLRFSSTVLGGL